LIEVAQSVRVRLEGSVELLEAELETLEVLLQALKTDWEAEAPLVEARLRSLVAGQAAVEQVLGHSERLPELAPFVEYRRALWTQLASRARQTLVGTAVDRAFSDAQVFERWQQLAQHTNRPQHGALLAHEELVKYSPEFMVGVVSVAFLLVTGWPLLTALVAALTWLWRQAGKVTTRYELTVHELSVEVSGQAKHSLPLQGLTQPSQRKWVGLRTLELPSSLTHFDELVAQVVAERRALDDERALVARHAALASEAVLSARATLTLPNQAPRRGVAMVTVEGALWLPHEACEALRAVVMKQEPLKLLGAEQLRFEGLPSALLYSRLDALRAAPQTRWSSLRDALSWSTRATEQGEQAQQLLFKSGTLELLAAPGDEAQLAQVRAHWLARLP
jgi:hypothetical protein